MAVSSQNQSDTPDDIPIPTSDTSPKLYREQQDLVDLIMDGRNVFFTGSAGCGKSTVLEAAVKELRAKGKQVDVVAPTVGRIDGSPSTSGLRFKIKVKV